MTASAKYADQRRGGDMHRIVRDGEIVERIKYFIFTELIKRK
jgi:hypothetical protein